MRKILFFLIKSLELMNVPEYFCFAIVLDPITCMRKRKRRHATARLYAYVDDLAVVCEDKEHTLLHGP